MPVLITVTNIKSGQTYTVKKTDQMLDYLSKQPDLKVSEPAVIKVEPIKKKEDAPPVSKIEVEKVEKTNGQAEVKVSEQSVKEITKQVEEIHKPKKRGRKKA